MLKNKSHVCLSNSATALGMLVCAQSIILYIYSIAIQNTAIRLVNYVALEPLWAWLYWSSLRVFCASKNCDVTCNSWADYVMWSLHLVVTTTCPWHSISHRSSDLLFNYYVVLVQAYLQHRWRKLLEVVGALENATEKKNMWSELKICPD